MFDNFLNDESTSLLKLELHSSGKLTKQNHSHNDLLCSKDNEYFAFAYMSFHFPLYEGAIGPLHVTPPG